MWNLYGKKYDLNEFMQHHPGGKEILERSKNEPDITALFETYHAFSNLSSIKTKLETFRVETEEKPYDMDFTSYNELTSKVREVYLNRHFIKADLFFYIRNSISILLYIYGFYGMLFFTGILRYIFAFLCGFLIISLGFNVMHDGSHYAVSTNSYFNSLLSKVWHYSVNWNDNIWFYHHVLNHHSFTGLAEKDPDMYNYRPVLRKLPDKKSFNFPKSLIKVIATLFVFILPGMCIGQSVMYLISALKYRLFKIQIPKKQYYGSFEYLVILCQLVLLYYCGFLTTFIYFVSTNIFYAINIIPDHDTFESHVENHYEKKEGKIDWLELQIRNSGNFNDNIVWTYLFGGINYQIEHHIFPNMSHIHYPVIAPIVKKYCQEKNIPYHTTDVVSAFQSFLKMIESNY